MNDYRQFVKSDTRRAEGLRIPARPDIVYKNKGWVGEEEFFECVHGEIQLAKLPLSDVVREYHAIGGVLHFNIYDNVVDGHDILTLLSAIDETVPGGINCDVLAGCSRATTIDKLRFYGSNWYDVETKGLKMAGKNSLEKRTIDGKIQKLQLVDPKLTDLDELKQQGWRARSRGVWARSFAGAFLDPPYGLMANYTDCQRIFDGIDEILFPVLSSSSSSGEAIILDWTAGVDEDRLPLVSSYFKAGLEWWGVYLYTIYIPELKRLAVVVGSTTD